MSLTAAVIAKQGLLSSPLLIALQGLVPEESGAGGAGTEPPLGQFLVNMGRMMLRMPSPAVVVPLAPSVVVIGAAAETDAALAMGVVAATSIGVAQETDEAIAMTAVEPAAWNPSNETGTWTFTNDDLTVDHVSGVGVVNVRSTVGRNSGKRYFEVVADDVYTVFHTGVRHDIGVTEAGTVGSGGSDVQGNAAAGQNGACYRIGGAIMLNGSSVGAVTALADGDVVGVAIDIDSGNIWFSLNGAWTQGDPGAGASPVGALAAGATYWIGAAVESGTHLKATIRTTLVEFSTAPPTGFTGWATT